MIILKVLGGLGNQMFQYAFARNLQLLYGEELKLDCSRYSTYKIRNFSLNNLNIPQNIKIINNNELNFYKKLKLNLYMKVYHIEQFILRNIKKDRQLGEKIYYRWINKGCYFNFDRYYYNYKESSKSIKYIFGYFQSEKYFKENLEIIRSELKVSIPPEKNEIMLLDEINNCEAIGISIREGDDYHNSNMGVCNKEFYYNGMDEIAGKVKNPRFYIFSDCIDKIKKEYKFKYPVKYIENMNDYQGLRLLYSCKHFVIANSSFSWWGAYLCDNKNKIVITPSRWYKNENKKPDIYCEFMNSIDV